MRFALTMKSFCSAVPVVLLMLSLQLPVRSQSMNPGANHLFGQEQRIRGKILSPQSGDLSGLRVEITGEDHAPIGARRTEVSLDGDFELWGSFGGQPEPYELKVLNMRGDVIHQEYVFLGDGRLDLEIELRGNSARPVQGTVSANDLRVPRKAQKQFSQAEKALREGKIEKSVQHLEKALEIYPAFVAAHNNLGLRHLQRGDHSRAETHFRRALELEPRCAFAHGNLAATLYQTQRYEQAEESARQGLGVEPQSPKLRYLLGLILEIRGSRDLALTELRSVSDEMPQARMVIARILIHEGQAAAATSELRHYLSSGDRKYFPLAQGLLHELEAAQSQTQSTP